MSKKIVLCILLFCSLCGFAQTTGLPAPNVTGTVALGNGGTGQTTGSAAFLAFIAAFCTSPVTNAVPQYNGTTWGCPAVSGVGSGTVNSGTAGQAAYYATSTSAVSGTSAVFFSGGMVGVNNTSPLNQLDAIGAVAMTGTGPATLTTTNGAFTSGATTMTVVSTTGYPTSGVLLIGQSNFTPELLSYTGTTSTTFTGLTRSLYGTSASASQATGTTVSLATVTLSDTTTVTPKLMCFWKGSCILSPITANLYNGIGTGTGGFGSGQTIFATNLAVGGGGNMANLGANGTGIVFKDSSSVSMGTWLDAGVTANGFLPLTIYSAAGTALPTCASGIKGERAIVSDATSPTFMGAYTSGGAITADVLCSYNGTTYAWLTH